VLEEPLRQVAISDVVGEPLQGMVTAVYLKDPADPQFEGDEDIQRYLEMMEWPVAGSR